MWAESLSELIDVEGAQRMCLVCPADDDEVETVSRHCLGYSHKRIPVET